MYVYLAIALHMLFCSNLGGSACENSSMFTKLAANKHAQATNQVFKLTPTHLQHSLAM